MKICISCNITTDVEHIYCHQCGKELGLRESVQKNPPNPPDSAANKTEMPFLLELWQLVKKTFYVFKKNMHDKITYKEVGVILIMVSAILFPLWRQVLVWSGVLDPDKPPVIDEIQWHPNEVSPGGIVTLSAVARDDSLKVLEFIWKSSQGIITSVVETESQKTRGNYKVQVAVPGPEMISAQTPLDIGLTVSDGNNESKEKIVRIQIVSKNNPPILTSITCNRPFIRAGESVELSVTAIDNDKDHLEITWECTSSLGKITSNDVNKETAVLEIPVRPFQFSQFLVPIKVKADDKHGGTASREIEIMVLPRGSGSPPGISRKPSTNLALRVERINVGEQKWILQANATGAGLTYRWTYNGEELSRESILIFDTSKIKTTPNQDDAKVTVTVEDKQKSRSSLVTDVPLNRPSSSSERH